MSDKEGGNEELSLPKATVSKIISETIPLLPRSIAPRPTPSNPSVVPLSDVSFTKPTRDLIINITMEFLRMLSSEANEISEKDSKKTITVDHIERALKELGFESYLPGVKESVGGWKEVNAKRVDRGVKMRNWGGLQASAEELERMQAELFAGAKGRMDNPGEAETADTANDETVPLTPMDTSAPNVDISAPNPEPKKRGRKRKNKAEADE